MSPSPNILMFPSMSNSTHALPSLLIAYIVPVTSSSNICCPLPERILIMAESGASSIINWCPACAGVMPSLPLEPFVNIPTTWLGVSLLDPAVPAPLIISFIKPCLTMGSAAS